MLATVIVQCPEDDGRIVITLRDIPEFPGHVCHLKAISHRTRVANELQMRFIAEQFGSAGIQALSSDDLRMRQRYDGCKVRMFWDNCQLYLRIASEHSLVPDVILPVYTVNSTPIDIEPRRVFGYRHYYAQKTKTPLPFRRVFDKDTGLELTPVPDDF